MANGNGDRITNRMLFDELQDVKKGIRPIPDLVEGKEDHETRLRRLEQIAYKAIAGLAVLLFLLEYLKPVLAKAFGG